MLKMSSRFSVSGNNRPFVLSKTYTAIAHSNHRFNRNAHTSFELFAVTSLAIVRNLWLLVHFLSDTMSGKFSHDTIAVGLTVILYSLTDVTYAVSSDGFLYSGI